MPEIAEAQALLTALAATDEVKVEAAHRQRLTQLHVSYGNALSPRAGPARRKPRKPLPEPASRRLVTRMRPNGRGRLRPMGRQLRARRAVRDAGACGGLPSATSRPDPIRPRPVSPIVSRDRRWFAGEYVEARDHLEERSPCSTRPRRRFGLPLRPGPRRSRDGLPRASAVAARRCRSCDFAHRPRRGADSGLRTYQHACIREVVMRPCSS